MRRITILITAAFVCMALTFPLNVYADAAVGGEHNFRSADYYVIVDAWDGYVNFRYGPGLEYGIYCPIYNGEVLYIQSVADNYYDGLTWGETYYDGYYGWISLTEVSDYYPEPQTEPPTYPQPEPQPVTEQPVQPDYQAGAAGKIWGVPDDQSQIQPVTDAYRYEKDHYRFAIPRINIASEDADSFNNLVYSDLSGGISKSVTMLEAGQTPGIDDLLGSSYKYHVNDDVLSVVIYFSQGGPWHEYSAFNFSVSDGKKISEDELFKTAKISQLQYHDMVSEAMDSAFLKLNEKSFDSADASAEETELYNSLRSKNISESNISSATAFINEEGRICIVAPVNLFMAQNSYSWEIIDLQTGQIIPWNSQNTDQETTGAADYYMVVSAPDNYLNLRKGPGITYDIITPVYNGEYLHVSEVAYNTEDSLYWGLSEYNGQTGWISISQASVVLP